MGSEYCGLVKTGAGVSKLCPEVENKVCMSAIYLKIYQDLENHEL